MDGHRDIGAGPGWRAIAADTLPGRRGPTPGCVFEPEILRREHERVLLMAVAGWPIGYSMIVIIAVRGDGVITARQTASVISIWQSSWRAAANVPRTLGSASR